MQNVMHIALYAGHTTQNDGWTMQNDGRTMHNVGWTHIMFTKDQRGGLRSTPGPQGTPPTPIILEKTLVSRNDFEDIRNKKIKKW